MKRYGKIIFTLLTISLITACGSGGEDGVEGTGLGGTVAVGAPVKNKSVVIRGKRGNKKLALTNELGKYATKFTGLTAPYLIKVDVNDNKSLYSIALEGGTANVHPLSDLIIRNWYEKEGRDIEAEFNNTSEIVNPPTNQDITVISDTIKGIVKNSFNNFSIANDFNFFTSEFDANQQGFDALLDQLNVNINIEKNTFNIIYIDQSTGIEGFLIDNLTLANDFSVPDTTAPSKPSELTSIAASDTKITILWNTASDDIGVAGYRIFQDETEIGTSTAPVFIINDLISQTEYCFSVLAFDSANNTSEKSNPSCSSTLSAIDFTPPMDVSNVLVEQIDSNSRKLVWNPSTSTDVIGSRVYFIEDGTTTLAATTVDSFFFDDDFSNRCYAISAFDANGNESKQVFADCTQTNSQKASNSLSSSANPTSQIFEDDINVTLLCSDTSNTGCDKIFYTLDNSEPSSASFEYTQPININSDTTIRFIAYDSSGKIEASTNVENYAKLSATSSVNIETLATPFGDKYNDNVSVTLSCTATNNVSCENIYYTLDNTPADNTSTVYQNPITISESTILRFIAYDSNSNAELNDQREYYEIISATIDNTFPVNTSGTAFINSGAETTSNKSLNLLLSATDNTGVNAIFIAESDSENSLASPAADDTNWNTLLDTNTYQGQLLYAVSDSVLNNSNVCLHIWFKDAANNISDPSIDCITYSSVIQTGPSSIQFVSSNYTVNENDGTASIVVRRSGDLSEAASVTYQLSQGTAIADRDYVDMQSTIQWTENDGNDKTILIPIKADLENETSEAVNINLTSVSANSTLGNPASTTLSILDTPCNGIIDSDITVDTTITEPCNFVSKDISVKNALLKINPGVTLIFDAQAGLRVDDDAALTAEGSEAKPIFFTSISPTPGHWNGVRYNASNDSRNRLNYVNMEYGGNTAIFSNGNLSMYGSTNNIQSISIKNSTFSHSAKNGVSFQAGTNVVDFANNKMFLNNEGPILLPANLMHKLDSASDYSNNQINGIRFYTSNDITTHQTWPLLNMNIYTGNIDIKADLVIPEGTRLIFDDERHLHVDDVGSLTASGTETNKIIFTNGSETPGAWDGIRFISSNDAKNILDHTLVEYGGGSNTFGEANVAIYSASVSNQTRIKISNSTFQHSSRYGVDFDRYTIITEFDNNVMTNNEGEPVNIPANLIHILNNTSTYSGNVTDIINVLNQDIVDNQFWNKLDVHYRIDNLELKADLQLEAGITLKFVETDSYLIVRTDGSLNADASSGDPIVFTSTDNQNFAGAWEGIQFVNSNSGSNKLINALVENAGAPAIYGDAAVSVYGTQSNPSRVIIQDTEIRNSDKNGIWYQSGNTVNADIESANIFTSISLSNVVVQ